VTGRKKKCIVMFGSFMEPFTYSTPAKMYSDILLLLNIIY